MNREPRPPLDNHLVSILSLQRILVGDIQSVEFESNSEAILLQRRKMKISIVLYHLCNYDVAQKQNDNHFVQLLRWFQMSAICDFLVETANVELLWATEG